MHVKICGITTLSDALAAVDAGADMIGYNFYPLSKRYIRPEACAALQNELRRRNVEVTTVGVFVNASQQEIAQTVGLCNLGYAQLSGDEGIEFARGLGGRWFKAIRPRSREEAVRDGEMFGRSTPAFDVAQDRPGLLVDSFRPGQYGGTGEVGDWGLAAALAGSFPILLAGGLTPENVQAAIQQVNPWGVDVASGVESSPARKDAGKMREFVKLAKSVKRDA
ncbi:MAG: phosphoribosylanthranilate isomerase [Anaerolineales bacterium]